MLEGGGGYIGEGSSCWRGREVHVGGGGKFMLEGEGRFMLVGERFMLEGRVHLEG